MESEYTRTVTILPSQVDPAGNLGVPDAFALFMDTATLAAERLRAGWGDLRRRGVFWITVKTMIRFLEPPRFLDEVEVTARMEPPEARRCRTHYRIRRGGETLVLGKTEWTFLEPGAGRQLPVAEVLPADLAFSPEALFPDPFPRIDTRFPDPPYARHRVAALDVDMARHMNNVAYVRAVANSFAPEEWERLGVREILVVFLSSAVEGDELELRRRTRGADTDVDIRLPDGRTLALVHMHGAAETPAGQAGGTRGGAGV